MTRQVKTTYWAAKRRSETNGVERRALLEAMLRGRRRAMEEGPAAWAMSPDLMDVVQEAQTERVAQVTREKNRQMVAQVDEALRRLAVGRYGICTDCGQSIPTTRLRALPFAVRCLGCQERLEGPGRNRSWT